MSIAARPQVSKLVAAHFLKCAGLIWKPDAEPVLEKVCRVPESCVDARGYGQTSEQLGYGDPSNGEFKSLAVVLCFLRFLLFSPQKATKRTKKKGIGSARLEGPFGHFF
jgi:hypothetical protein